MVDSKALQARADGLKIKQKEIAAKVGISQSALSKKINNERPMTLEEVEKIAEVLKIEPRFWMGYFFCNEKEDGALTMKPKPVPVMEIDGVRFSEVERQVVRCYRELARHEKKIIAALFGVFRNIDLVNADFEDLAYDLSIED